MSKAFAAAARPAGRAAESHRAMSHVTVEWSGDAIRQALADIEREFARRGLIPPLQTLAPPEPRILASEREARTRIIIANSEAELLRRRLLDEMHRLMVFHVEHSMIVELQRYNRMASRNSISIEYKFKDRLIAESIEPETPGLHLPLKWVVSRSGYATYSPELILFGVELPIAELHLFQAGARGLYFVDAVLSRSVLHSMAGWLTTGTFSAGVSVTLHSQVPGDGRDIKLDIERLILHPTLSDFTPTFEIIERGAAIRCLLCRHESWNPRHKKARVCPQCGTDHRGRIDLLYSLLYCFDQSRMIELHAQACHHMILHPGDSQLRLAHERLAAWIKI
jgi:hypothetical protein